MFAGLTETYLTRMLSCARKGDRVIGLLVSVRSVAEAEAALAGGAAIIDVKEPTRGALGAADLEIVEAIIDHVADRVPVSAALGELVEVASTTLSRTSGRLAYAKIGLARCGSLPDWQSRWEEAIAQLPAEVQPVAVAYADWQDADAPDPQHILEAAQQTRCRTLLFDTFDKSAGSLLDLLDVHELAALVRVARERGLDVVLAGRLQPEHVQLLAELEPDLLGVRGAVCRGGRSGMVCHARIASFVDLLRHHCNGAQDRQPLRGVGSM